MSHNLFSKCERPWVERVDIWYAQDPIRYYSISPSLGFLFRDFRKVENTKITWGLFVVWILTSVF